MESVGLCWSLFCPHLQSFLPSLLQHGMGREYAGVLCKSSERYQDIVYLNAKVLQKLLEVNRGLALAMGINFGNTGGWAGVYQFGLTGQRIITGPGA